MKKFFKKDTKILFETIKNIFAFQILKRSRKIFTTQQKPEKVELLITCHFRCNFPAKTTGDMNLLLHMKFAQKVWFGAKIVRTGEQTFSGC